MSPKTEDSFGINTEARTGRFLRLGVILLFAVLFCLLSAVSAYADWYNSSWQYRKKITIDNTKVTATLTDFPVLISLSSDTDLTSNAQGDGDDILFTSSDGTTKLDHEIESYSSGTLVAWVKVPSLAGSADTVIYMYYGNGSCASQENVTGVWDTNYTGVWHLHDDFEDSTSNNNDGTNFGSTNTTGKVADAQDFDGVDDYIDIGTGCLADSNWTLEFWLKPSSPSDYGRLFIQGSTGCASRQIMAYWHSGHVEVRTATDGSVGDPQAATGAITDDGSTWSHFIWTYDGSTHALYVNGQTFSGSTTGTNVGIAGSNNIGRRDAGNYWAGGIDEVRISNTAHSADWIQTSYNNQSSPSTFYTAGDEREQEVILTQTRYRWRNDDGSESAATWAAAEDTALGEAAPGRIYRLRFLVANTGTASSGAATYKLQVAETDTCGSGTYSDVPTGDTGHWKVTSSTYLTDGNSTSNVEGGLTDPDGMSFVAGEVKDSGNTTGSITLDDDEFTEIEFAVMATENATYSGEYCFRLYEATGDAVLDGYSEYGQVGVSSGLFKYRKAVTIQGDQIGTSCSSDLTDFPMLVNISSDDDLRTVANGGHVEDASGYDIIFRDSDGKTQLDHEVETYDSSTGELVAWVKIPTLTSGEDKSIFIYYGNSAVIEDTQNVSGVWDDNYEAVWHLKENPAVAGAGEIIDSTSNNNHGTDYGSMDANDQVAAQIGYGLQLDGGNDYIDAGTFDPSTGDLTVSLWLKWDGTTGDSQIIIAKRDSWATGNMRWQFARYVTDGDLWFQDKDSDAQFLVDIPDTTDWHLFCVTRVGSTGLTTLYIDGEQSGSATETMTFGSDTGARVTIGAETGGAEPLKGSIDEVRISSTARDACWIETEYNNQNSPSTFYELGSEEPIGFEYYKQITLNSSMIGTSCGGDLTDFPLLVSITGDNDLRTAPTGSVQHGSGYDIIFKDADGLKLDHEIEKYDGTAGDLVAWVRIPTLVYDDATIIYMYYGNSDVTESTENVSGVWDENYVGVWHMNDATTSSVADSTSNSNDGSKRAANAPQETTGKAGQAQQYSDNDNDYIQVSHDSSLNMTDQTIEVWFKFDGSVPTDENPGFVFKNESFQWAFNGGNQKLWYGLWGDSTQSNKTSWNVDQWYHAVITFKDSTAIIYVDGDIDITDTDNTQSVNNTTNDVYLGRKNDGGFSLNGWLDEVRISNIARDACWIETSFNNQNSPGTYYTVGDAVETTPASAPTAVDLSSFKATGEGDKVAVTWETAQELENLGFHLYRSTTKEGPYVRITDTLIPGLSFSVRGRSYSFIDGDVIQWDLYYYKLEDIDIRGKKTMHGPVCVDWDGDGMPDDWEIARGPDPRVDDAHLDPDGDGWTNLEEYWLGTDPQNPDTPESWRVASLESVSQPLGKGMEIISSDESGIILELRTGAFEAAVVEQGGEAYDRLRIPEYIHGWTQETGKPEMPVKGVILDMPEGKSAALEIVSVDKSVWESYWIYPVPERIGVESGGVVEVQEVFAMDEEAYLEDAFYPGLVVEPGESFTYRGEGKQQVLFYPLSFNPGTGDLEFFSRIRVRVTYESTGVSVDTSGSLAWAPPGSESGTSYKLHVQEEGIYRVTGAWLEGQGVDVAALTLSTLRMYTLGEEIAIHVFDDNGNNLFDPEDHIEFYGQEVPSDYSKYTNQNVYWLATEGEGAPKRMGVADGTPGGGPPASTHTFTYRHELDEFYLVQVRGEDDMDRWYSADFALGSGMGGGPTNFALSVPGVGGSGKGHLSVAMVGLTELEHEVQVALNGLVVGTYVWSGFMPYEAVIGNVDILEGNNTVTLTCLSGSDPDDPDGVALDYLEITYPMVFAAQNDLLAFTHDGGYGYEVTGFDAGTIGAYDITLPAEVQRIENVRVTGEGPYTLEMEPVGGEGERTYMAVSSLAVKTPASVSKVVPANLGDTSNGADWILITHRELGWDEDGLAYSWLQNLAALREGQGLRVKVVDVEHACDEFGYGILGPRGVKHFLQYAYRNWTAPAPSYVLLVGDGTYDPKDNWQLGESVPYLPVYLGFTEHMGEAALDDWFVRLSGSDAVADMHIGRLPAASVAQAEVMAGKIVSYESTPNSRSWEKNVLLVADNVTEDYERLFETMNNDAALRIPEEGMNPPFEAYLEDYGSAWALNAAIVSRMNQEGALVVNYSGHGSTQVWAHENIFDVGDIGDLGNWGKLPFFVAMTCLNGDFVEPEDFGFPSLAEALVRASGKGAVGVLTSTGMTPPEGQHILDVGLFEAIFEKDKRKVGEAVGYAKQEVLAQGSEYGDVITSFMLFGDPAMLLKVPLPRMPAGVSVSVEDGSVKASWSEAQDCDGGAVAGYNLYRGDTAGGPYEKVNGSVITGTEFTDGEASIGTWYYVVRSVDGEGVESAASEELSVTVGVTSGARSVGGNGQGGSGGACFISTVWN